VQHNFAKSTSVAFYIFSPQESIKTPSPGFWPQEYFFAIKMHKTLHFYFNNKVNWCPHPNQVGRGHPYPHPASLVASGHSTAPALFGYVALCIYSNMNLGLSYPEAGRSESFIAASSWYKHIGRWCSSEQWNLVYIAGIRFGRATWEVQRCRAIVLYSLALRSIDFRALQSSLIGLVSTRRTFDVWFCHFLGIVRRHVSYWPA